MLRHTEKKRKFQFGTKEKGFTVQIKETFSNFGLHVWPAGILLAEYIWNNPNLVVNNVVLELGAGVALPSILCAKLGARHVVATDMTTKHNVLENIESIRKLNNIPTMEEYKSDQAQKRELEKQQRQREFEQLKKKQEERRQQQQQQEAASTNNENNNNNNNDNDNKAESNGISLIPSVSLGSGDEYTTDDDSYVTASASDSDGSSYITSPRSPNGHHNNNTNKVSHKYEQTIKKSNRLNAKFGTNTTPRNSRNGSRNGSRKNSIKGKRKRRNKRKSSRKRSGTGGSNDSDDLERQNRILAAKRAARLKASPMTVMDLVWGRFTSQSIKLRPNLIIAADVFYNENDFEDILANVQYYFNHGCAAFYSVVQKRGTSRTLGTLLLKWKMKVEEIDILHTVMGSDYLNIEESEKMILVKITSAKQNKKSTHHRTQSVLGLMKAYNSNSTNGPNDALYENTKNIRLDGTTDLKALLKDDLAELSSESRSEASSRLSSEPIENENVSGDENNQNDNENNNNENDNNNNNDNDNENENETENDNDIDMDNGTNNNSDNDDDDNDDDNDDDDDDDEDENIESEVITPSPQPGTQ